MLTTGLAKGDAITLKLDCMTHVEKTDTYSLSVWRKKVKKEGKFDLRSQVPPIINKLKEMNTQLVPSLHPDGSHAIYLFNDAGKPVGPQWFDYWLKIHKTVAAEAHPALGSVINEMVPHQLRHTFACMLREGGADIMQIQELMLHENINTTAKYTRESDKVKVVMVKRLIEGQ